jgi:hypothetical protein
MVIAIVLAQFVVWFASTVVSISDRSRRIARVPKVCSTRTSLFEVTVAPRLTPSMRSPIFAQPTKDISVAATEQLRMFPYTDARAINGGSLVIEADG